jgi:hypothetical protein
MLLSRDDVLKVLGPVDDGTVALVIGTGATREELAEAKAWFANDEPMMSIGRPLPGGRAADLVEILRRLDEVEFDDVER